MGISLAAPWWVVYSLGASSANVCPFSNHPQLVVPIFKAVYEAGSPESCIIILSKYFIQYRISTIYIKIMGLLCYQSKEK